MTDRYASRTLGVLGLVFIFSPASAQETGGGFTDEIDFAGHVSLATDYVFRGISQTNEEPQIQTEWSWTHDSGIYAGVWSSNTDYGGPGNSMEFDPFIGFAGTVGDSGLSYDVGYWYYYYPGAESDFDYAEIYAILTYTMANTDIAPSVWYADDYFGEDFFDNESSLAYQVALTHTFPPGFSISGAVGEQTFDEPNGLGDQDFTYWNIGVSQPWGGFTFDLRWHDTDGVQADLAPGELVDGRLVGRVTRDF